jgi:hypothetical protein
MGANMAHFIWWKPTRKLNNLSYDTDLNSLLQDEQERIKMETFCSFLLGPEGNYSYHCAGRIKNQTKEERKMNGEH